MTTVESFGIMEGAGGGNRENSPMSLGELPTDLMDLESGKQHGPLYGQNECLGGNNTKSPIIFVSDFEDEDREEEEKKVNKF
jgi:hypothetical protein